MLATNPLDAPARPAGILAAMEGKMDETYDAAYRRATRILRDRPSAVRRFDGPEIIGSRDDVPPDDDLERLVPAGLKCTVTKNPPYTAYVWQGGSRTKRFWEATGATQREAVALAAERARQALGDQP